LAARVLAAHEEARERIRRELHDDTSQALTSLMVRLETLSPASHDATSLQQELDTLVGLAQTALSGISRILGDLRPPTFAGRELGTALNDYAAHVRAVYGIEVDAQVVGTRPESLDGTAETSLYQLLTGAVMLAAHHALARQISVTVHFRKSSVRALVEDDGAGTAPVTPQHESALRELHERATAVGTALEVDSAPGKGTQVVVDLPACHLENGAST
jgi:signal transduction histidine kinase